MKIGYNKIKFFTDKFFNTSLLLWGNKHTDKNTLKGFIPFNLFVC